MRVLLVGMPISQKYIASKIPIPEMPIALGVGYVAAYARQDDFVRRHANIETLRYVVGRPDQAEADDEELVQMILLRDPDVVGFSCYIWNMSRIAHVSVALKIIAPQLTIVWGGPEAGLAPEETLRENSGVDIVVRGEGEVTFADLVRHLCERKDLRTVPGIAYRDGDGVVVTAERERVISLDQFPSPYLAGTIDPKEEPEGNHMLLEGYRECPFRCGYCVYPGKPRFFSMDRVRREIELAFQLDVHSFCFVDAYLNISKARTLALADIFEEMDPRQSKMRGGFVMAQLLDGETVEAVARMKTPMIKTGLQSTNPEVLRNIRHRVDLERFREAIRLLREHGIRVQIQMIAGLPGDTLDGLKRTIEFAISLQPHELLCFTWLVLRGTYLYQMRDRFQVRYDPRAPHRAFSHYTLPYDEMLECLEFAHRTCAEYNGLDDDSKQKVVLGDVDAWREAGGRRRRRTYAIG